MEQFRDLGAYVEDRARRLHVSIRALSIELGWGESYVDGAMRGTFKMSVERARQLGLYFHIQLNHGRSDDSPTLEEYIAMSLAAGLPWPPPAAISQDVLAPALSGLDPFALLELTQYADYLRRRPKPQELIEQAAERLEGGRQEPPEAELPEEVLALARRIAALPKALQGETLARLGDTLSFVERLAGTSAG